MNITDENNQEAQEEKISLFLTTAEIRNIAQGLDLLHSKCVDQIQALHPFEPQAQNLRKYFKDKQVEINKQIKVCNDLLTK